MIKKAIAKIRNLEKSRMSRSRRDNRDDVGHARNKAMDHERRQNTPIDSERVRKNYLERQQSIAVRSHDSDISAMDREMKDLQSKMGFKAPSKRWGSNYTLTDEEWREARSSGRRRRR